jgi:hypothetical protein
MQLLDMGGSAHLWHLGCGRVKSFGSYSRMGTDEM